MNNSKKIRYAIIGSGWRSRFYLRIAKALPDLFEVTGMLVRSKEKMDTFSKEYGIFVTMNKVELMNTKPDFIVVVINKQGILELCIELMREGIPILTETPPAVSIEDLQEFWRTKVEFNAKVQVAEQYLFYPKYDARLKIAKEGFLGDIQTVTLSGIHGYHGVSMIRSFLGAHFTNVKISAKKYSYPIAVTQDRDGMLKKGETKVFHRVRADLEFENGTVGFYDYCGLQYHTYVRSQQLIVQGTRGEIENDKVCYLTEDNVPMRQMLTPVTDGVHPGIESIGFAGKPIYQNPFNSNLLAEDETAIARILLGMKHYLETGEEWYSLAEAMQDTYLALLMNEAVARGEEVTSTTQEWA